MAITNYTELQTATLNWLSRTGDTKLTTLAPDFILFAEAKMNRMLRTRQMETSATLTPTAGVASLPTDYISMRRAYINTSVPVELEYMPPEQFYLKFPVTAGGSKYFTIEGETMVLADRGSTTVKILYYQQIPDLATNTTNWLLTAHPDLYLSATLAEAYDVIKKEDLAQKWLAKAAMLVEMISSSDKEGKYSGSAMRVIAS
jgi:hypothetical protein